MHAKDRTTDPADIHRRRPALRKAVALRKTVVLRKVVALLSGALLAGASLTLAPQAVAEAPADGAAAVGAEDFQQVTLAKGEPEVGEPMSLAVLPSADSSTTRRSRAERSPGRSGDSTPRSRSLRNASSQRYSIVSSVSRSSDMVSPAPSTTPWKGGNARIGTQTSMLAPCTEAA